VQVCVKPSCTLASASQTYQALYGHTQRGLSFDALSGLFLPTHGTFRVVLGVRVDLYNRISSNYNMTLQKTNLFSNFPFLFNLNENERFLQLEFF